MVISSQPLPAKVWQRIKDPHVDMLTLDNTVYRIQRIPELGSGIVTGLQPCRCSSAFDSSCSSGSLPAFSPACSPLAAAASAKAPALTAQQHAGRPQFRSDSGLLSADNLVAGRENRRGRGAGPLAATRRHLLSPDIFIPLAEQTGLITQLTEDIVRKIFTDLGPSAAAAAGSAHIHQPVGR